MNEEDQKELSFKLTDLAIEKGCNHIDLIRLLMSFLMGALHTAKFSQDNVNDILDNTKDSFRNMNKVE